MIVSKRIQLIGKKKIVELPLAFELETKPVTQAIATAKSKFANAIRKTANIATAIRHALPAFDSYEIVFGTEFFKLGARNFGKHGVQTGWLCRHCKTIIADDDLIRHARVEMRLRQRREAGLA